MSRYNVLSLQVSGSRMEGFDVLDTSRVGEVELSDADGEAAVIEALVDEGFLAESCTPSMVSVKFLDESFFEVKSARTGRPMLQLRREVA